MKVVTEVKKYLVRHGKKFEIGSKIGFKRNDDEKEYSGRILAIKDEEFTIIETGSNNLITVKLDEINKTIETNIFK